MTNMNEAQLFQSQAQSVHCPLNEAGTQTHTHTIYFYGTTDSSGSGPSHNRHFTITLGTPLWMRDRHDAETST